MNWFTVTWLVAAAASLTLGLIHAAIWLRERRSYAHLLFAIAAVAVAAIAMGELGLALSRTPEQYATRLRWTHLPIFVAVVAIIWFVRVYFDAGRAWLAWLACGARLAAVVLNFAVPPNLNFVEITGLRELRVPGDGTVSMPIGSVSARTRVGEAASLLLLAFVADASVTRWRRGGPVDRRRVRAVGGALLFFVVFGAGHSALIHAGLLHVPYMISLAFLVPVAVMGYQLGSDVLRAARLSRALESSEAALRENQQRMDLAVASADLGLWRWDVAGDAIVLDDRSRALLGVAGQDPVTLDGFLARLVPEDRDLIRQAVRQSLDGGGDFKQEYRVRDPDGSVRWISSRGRVEFNGGGTPAVMRGVCFDITRRKLADERFRLVVEASPNVMLMVDAVGRIVLANAQAEAVFGYAREEMIGQPVEMLLPPHLTLAHRAQRRGFSAAPAARRMGAGGDLFARRKDGREIPIEVGLNPVQSEEGTMVLASVIDITERRQAEREQVMQRNELAHLARVAMLGELSGSLAHELNQPLTAILSNAQAAQEFLARDEPDLEEVRGILTDIVDEDRRAGEVIRRLRLLFRKGEVLYESIDLNDVVTEVLKLMNGDLVNQGVAVHPELASGIPPVRGDRVQLQQVLINLIVNAADAMAGAEVSARRLFVSTSLDDGGIVHFRITDTGCGIPAEGVERIFEPFHTTKAKGLGLGLAVCRTIVAAHGGKLWATNNADRGATFHLTLAPAAPAHPATAAAPAATAATTAV